MNLHSDYPYWMIREGFKNAFPTLCEPLKTDVLIVGGGISGALIGQRLHRAGMDITILDKRHIGFGSTSASTAMLQYEIDTPLFRLMEMRGERAAIRSYELCAEAIGKIGKLASKVPEKSGFEAHPSLFYASTKKDVKEIIEPEYKARKAAGFKVKMLDEAAVESKFGFRAPAAILSELAAHVNPYQLTQYLLKKLQKDGVRIFDLTEVESWQPHQKSVELRTTQGHSITAKFLIVACGFESQNYLPKDVTQLNSTYAIVSKPMETTKNFWYKNALIWETKHPYLYIRTTRDNRILVGGRDEPFYNPEKRDALLPRKHKQLEADFQKLFPNLLYQTDFAWAGTFGETKDGLPYIGSYNHPRTLFAMGYGGNGITFSVAAADILYDIIMGKKSSDIGLFAFDR